MEGPRWVSHISLLSCLGQCGIRSLWEAASFHHGLARSPSWILFMWQGCLPKSCPLDCCLAWRAGERGWGAEQEAFFATCSHDAWKEASSLCNSWKLILSQAPVMPGFPLQLNQVFKNHKVLWSEGQQIWGAHAVFRKQSLLYWCSVCL